MHYDVRLRILNVSLNLTLKAINVYELELMLKK